MSVLLAAACAALVLCVGTAGAPQTHAETRGMLTQHATWRNAQMSYLWEPHRSKVPRNNLPHTRVNGASPTGLLSLCLREIRRYRLQICALRSSAVRVCKKAPWGLS